MNSLEKAGLYGMIYAIGLMLLDYTDARDIIFYVLAAYLIVSYIATLVGNGKDVK